jgi:hypothetical protein
MITSCPTISNITKSTNNILLCISISQPIHTYSPIIISSKGVDTQRGLSNTLGYLSKRITKQVETKEWVVSVSKSTLALKKQIGRVPDTIVLNS